MKVVTNLLNVSVFTLLILLNNATWLGAQEPSKQSVKPYIITQAEKKATTEKMADNYNNDEVKANSNVTLRAKKPLELSEADKKASEEKPDMEQSKMLSNQEVPATTVNTNSPFPIVAKAIDKSKVVNVKATKTDPNDASKKLQSDEK